MKRIISLFLAFVMLGSVCVFAASETKYTDYMASAGYLDSIPSPDSPITRQDAAMMVGRAIGAAKDGAENVNNPYADIDSANPAYSEILALGEVGIMVGNGSGFNPGSNITREEFAIIIERVYKFASNDLPHDEEVFEQRFVDFNDISEWARQSVVNVVKNGIFLARKGKYFKPKELVTYEEAAEAVYKVAKINVKPELFPEGEAYGDPEKLYSVYQKAIITPNAGIAGFGVVARFNGSPGEIYFSRTTTKPDQENRRGNPVSPVVFGRVTDPDGNVVARVRLDYKENGTMQKIVNINDGKPGIWQIQIINGRLNDEVAIGINGASSWGVRGEVSFKYTETTPKEGYFWVPKKFQNASIAGTEAFSIKDESGTLIASSTNTKRGNYGQTLENSSLKPESVYSISVPETFRGDFWMEGVAGLLCPTADMARDLKGNVVYTSDGVQCHGPLQARAYEMAHKIYNDNNGDFSIDISGRPETLPENLQNPLAESYNFGIYSGFLSSAETALETISLVPGPYLGHRVSLELAREGKPPFDTETWEVGNFDTHGSSTGKFAGLLTTNSELNYYYGEKGVADRIALMLLNIIYTSTDDGWFCDSKNTEFAGKTYPTTYGNFSMGPATENFWMCKNYFDPEVRDLIQEGLEMIADKNMNFRGCGPSNQWGFGIRVALYMYRATGEERYHDYFKRAIEGWNTEELWPDYVGVTPAGYPIENAGADGSYFYMNVADYAHYHKYTQMPGADPKTCENIREIINKALEFEKFFIVTPIKGLGSAAPNHFTSRKEAAINTPGGHSAWVEMVDEYPLARAFWDRVDKMMYETNENGVLLNGKSAITMAHYVATDEHAWAKLKNMYDKYDNYHGDSRSTSGIAGCYETMLERDFVEPATLPCDDVDQVWEHPGIFAVKHKGIYISSFYESTLPDKKVAANSWYGGGPTVIWSEATGPASYSKKHIGYSKAITGEENVISSCIFGYNAAGNLVVSGKELATLEKIDDATYAISGLETTSGKTVRWEYKLTDEGITMIPSVSTLGEDEEYYINLPVMVMENPEYKVNLEPGKLTCEYQGRVTEFTWDARLEAELLDEEVEGTNALRRLRIKLSHEIPAAISIVAK